MLDGATGKMVGKRYFVLPDNKETYMSPIMHHRKDGSQYVLFGNGGETVPGELKQMKLFSITVYSYV